MALLISFLIGIQLFYAVVSVPFPLSLSTSCNSLGVRIAAEVALNKVNENRKEGYVLGLQRIFDVLEAIQGDESAFDLILDVLETQCHVRSRKPWKECEFRSPHETVFGNCEIIMKFNRVTNDSTLYKSDCSLHTFPRSVISRICPDCPVGGNPSEERFQAAARESLAKFNAEINHYHYFAVREVTKASSQWVVGESNFVEYIIQETSCRKSPPVSDISKCPLLPDETADSGLCKGSVINSQLEFKKFVTVQCEFFPHLPPANVTETPPKQEEEEVLVTNCPPGSLDSSPTVASIKEEAPTTFSPYRKAISLSTDCPGEVAVNIVGLNLPSRQQSETKSDVQH